MAQNDKKTDDDLKEFLDTPSEPQEEPIPENHHEATTEPSSSTDKPSKNKKKFDFKAFWHTKKGKITVIAAAIALIIAVVFTIPASRYAVAGLVIKKDLSVQVVDSNTGKPVTSVQVSLAGQTAKTDKDGKVTFHNVPVGQYSVSAKKTYYQNGSGNALVPILSNAQTAKVSLVATGRQVPISVTNKITNQPLANVEVVAGDATVTTDDAGVATIVLPADKATVNATFKLNNYNSVSADVTVTEQQDDKNKFSLTPAGKIYFLSKRTGKINVMKSDLDGSNATIAVAGTGQESETQTVLLASRDWKYLALKAKRDSDVEKLYLINTADDKLTLMDEGAKVSFTPIGWSNESFVYQVVREDAPEWQPKHISIKSFNAAVSKITTLDDAEGVGSSSANWAREVYTSTYILGDHIVYGKHWNYSYGSVGLIAGKKDGIYTVKTTAEGKQTVKDFAATTSSYLEATLYKPNEIYFRLAGNPAKFYEYEDGKVEETTEVNDNNFYNQTYATYLVSPSAKYTFWYESRDGKKVSFVGDQNGANGKEVLADDDFVPYGWYSDEYLLFAKKGSELYIAPRNNPTNVSPLKITDYHRPAVSFPGYGYGYGGGS
jgi:hypothetical protein